MLNITIAVKDSSRLISFREQPIHRLPLDFYDRVNTFLDELSSQSAVSEPESKPAIDWQEAAHTIDRFRDRISACYGFRHNLIEPVYIADASDPLKDCAFDVLGIGYEVKKGELTCTGEVKSDEC